MYSQNPPQPYPAWCPEAGSLWAAASATSVPPYGSSALAPQWDPSPRWTRSPDHNTMCWLPDQPEEPRWGPGLQWGWMFCHAYQKEHCRTDTIRFYRLGYHQFSTKHTQKKWTLTCLKVFEQFKLGCYRCVEGSAGRPSSHCRRSQPCPAQQTTHGSRYFSSSGGLEGTLEGMESRMTRVRIFNGGFITVGFSGRRTKYQAPRPPRPGGILGSVLIAATRVRIPPIVLCCVSCPSISHTFLSISLYNKT